mgnify:CR=1 FL=1|tara:strand:- start:1377 stop:1997 length:621 start_codon:yes stop_codon:yes gene_type:complete
MRNYSENNSASYTLLNCYYKQIETKTNYACFASLGNRYGKQISRKERVAYIIIRQTKCEETKAYTQHWLKYIGKMFALNYVITEDTFQFKSTKLKTSDLIVCTLVRSLWEGKPHVMEQTLELFKALFDENKYSGIKDLLARFCFAWSKLEKGSYGWNNHHIAMNPADVQLRTTKEFKELVKSKMNVGVMKFFSEKEVKNLYYYNNN